MGLEIQDDNSNQPIFQKSEVSSDYHSNRANQLNRLRENFVDLGLPSGTLWCKYNLGATNGSTKESWYGNYYAWGELQPKDDYRWYCYKFGQYANLTKYTKEDQLTSLQPTDDVVISELGTDFRMPTYKECEELIALPNKWVIDYNGVKGLNGRIFTGTNGKELFIPAAGSYWSTFLNAAGRLAHLWSSTLYKDDSTSAYCLFFSDAPILHVGETYSNREEGFTVRGVLNR